MAKTQVTKVTVEYVNGNRIEVSEPEGLDSDMLEIPLSAIKRELKANKDEAKKAA